MFLYDKTKNTIDVYKMTTNSEKSAEFKKKEMQKIPFEERVLKAWTDDKKLLENYGLPIYWLDLEEERHGWPGGHHLGSYPMNDDEIVRQLKLMKSYYNGEFKDKHVAQIERLNDNMQFEIFKYYLITKSYSFFKNKHGDYIMDDIISIPRSLYLLQLLEQGLFYNIVDEDISEQLQTFDISESPIRRISIKELKKMFKYLLLPGSFQSTMIHVKTTQKILRRIRE